MLPEGLQIGRYRLLHLLGRGAKGEVYLAEDTGIERQVAIKVIRSDIITNPDSAVEAIHLFEQEMKTIAKFNHPRILSLFDYGEIAVNGTSLPYMVMPFCQDGTLAGWVRQRRNSTQLSPADVAHFARQAADALQHAHDQQVIHRDVKPSNFLIRNNKEYPNHPDLLLADFGLARLSSTTSSMSFTIGGTPLYMSPEQWRGHPVPATDQYMLAAMTYELLAGRPPFKGGLEQLMVQHTESRAKAPSRLNPQVSVALDAVILRALAKRPEDRFPSVSVFARAFQATLQSTEVQDDGVYTTIDNAELQVADTSSLPVFQGEQQDVRSNADTNPRTVIE